MPRNITVTFGDGTTHTYQNAPDDVTPDSVQARAEKEFSKSVMSLDGGRATTGSTQPGTMDAYTTRRPPPKRGIFDALSAPFEMGMELSQKPRAEQAAFIAPAVEAIGMAGGGAIGSGVGPLGTVAGSAAGYAGAKGLMRLVGGTNKPESLSQTAQRVGGDVVEGATMEIGGQLIGKAAPYVGKVVKVWEAAWLMY